jgi:hypothetical protein
MVRFATVLLRGVIATFTGLLIAGGTLTFAADRATPQRPTLVAATSTAPATLEVPDVTGQAYVFAKGILQDRGFAWHVSGSVQGYAANPVATQQPTPGTTVLDNGAPMITLTLSRNPAYVEHGTPENDAPYPGTSIQLPANVARKPVTSAPPRVEPVPVPVPVSPTPAATTPPAVTPTPAPTTPTVTPASVQTTPTVTTPAPVTPTPAVTTPVVSKPVAPKPAATPVTPVTPAPTPTPAAPVSSTPRAADFTVPGAPKEPTRSVSLPDRVAALASWMESHHDPTAANLNHWLYEHSYIVAGARFGWWHGAQALEALITVDRRAEALWGVGSQSRTTAGKALAEVRARAR